MKYKNEVINRLGFSTNQVTILKHDLHYSYNNESVLALLTNNNIVPSFVPAGFTDVMQECDTVVNKPFKNGVRNGYRDHMDSLFQKHLSDGLDAAHFAPKLTMGALKPFLTSFVQRGIEALKTPKMKQSIANAFANDGLFTIIRSSEMPLAIQEEKALMEVAVPEAEEDANGSDGERNVSDDETNGVIDAHSDDDNVSD